MGVNVFVNESSLSVAQFENFMAKGQAGIEEKEAAKILKENRRNLPCRKLYGHATEEIKSQIMAGSHSGTVEKEGVILHWMMDGDLEGMSPEEKEKVVSVALDGDAEESSVCVNANAPKGWSPDHQLYNGVKVYFPRANDMFRLADRTWKKRVNLPAEVRIFNEDGSYRSFEVDLGKTAKEIVSDYAFADLDRLIIEKAGAFFEGII